MSAQIIYHEGNTIFYIDLSFLRSIKDIQKVIDESIKYIRHQPEHSVLTLTNVQGMHFNNDIRDAITSFVKGNEPFVKSGAVIGLSGLIQIVYNGMLKVTGRNLKAFKEKEEALKYLISR